jgi:hypothetical protein
MTEITEIIKMDATRVDAVKNPANGFPILMMKAVTASGDINEKPDIAAAEKVLALLAKLIQAEAAEMATGVFDEVCDIQLLSQAAELMMCFRRREQMGADSANAAKELADAIAERAQELDAPNPLAKETMSDTDKTSAPETEAVTETPEAPNVDELVKSAVAEVTTAYEERIEALEAKLTKVLETPIPGGPAMTAPAHMRGTVQKAEKLAEAARYTTLAEQVTDPDLKRFYKEAAANARSAA